MSPEGLTLRQLYYMALGKSEFLGGTSAPQGVPVLPFDENYLAKAIG